MATGGTRVEVLNQRRYTEMLKGPRLKIGRRRPSARPKPIREARVWVRGYRLANGGDSE